MSDGIKGVGTGKVPGFGRSVVAEPVALTDDERRVIERLAHPVYTAENIEKWAGRRDIMFVPPPMQNAIAAKGFYEAVKAMVNAESKA